MTHADDEDGPPDAVDTGASSDGREFWILTPTRRALHWVAVAALLMATAAVATTVVHQRPDGAAWLGATGSIGTRGASARVVATLRRREPESSSSGDDSPLPADIAAGPDPQLWAQPVDWLKAGGAWATEHLALHERGSWRSLLPEGIRYAVSALGRAHARHDGYTPPWEC